MADLSQTIIALSQALATAQQALVTPGLLGQARQHLVITSGPALSLDPPSVPSLSSRRARTVADLVSSVEGKGWIAIRGATSTGKTVLVRLIAERLGGRVCWVDFKGLDDDGATYRVEQACAALAGYPAPPLREDWYRAACAALGAGAILILARLPNLAIAPQLSSRVVPLVKECGRSGVRVLSSSIHPLPLSVRSDLAGGVADVPAPPLTNEEAGEVLLAYGASAAFVTKHSGVVNQLAKRHPFLLVAACQYLQRGNWGLGDAEILDLLGGAHTADFGTELYRKLQATVSDADSKELLYRLTLPGGRFARVQMERLAVVPQAIPRPAEKIPDLINAWVERVGEGMWAVSPLCERLAADYLDSETRKRCHDSLGELVVGKGAMNQRDAHEAIVHFREAREWGKAGSILMLILNAAWNSKADLRGEPVLSLWAAVALPADMDLNLRLVIRGLHVALFHRLGRSIDFVMGDLDSLLAQADGRHKVGAAGAVSFAVSAVAGSLPAQSNRWVRRFLEISAQAEPSRGQRRRSRKNR
ncbi:MAG TPA: hypothetical protein VH682_22480 [Gemmataceae bacterium]